VHPDWDSYLFNYGRNEVRSFLVSCALYWLECFHADGLRTDAVASMLYLDYSREEGEWVPNRYGGNENLEALDFLRECNAAIGARVPDALTFAEESTAWPGSRCPPASAGSASGSSGTWAGCTTRCSTSARTPSTRRNHHDELTFRSIYATSEQFLLPLSHDEVVHREGFAHRPHARDDWQQRANLRCCTATSTGCRARSSSSWGDDFGSREEWDTNAACPGIFSSRTRTAGSLAGSRRSTVLHRAQPALHERDRDPAGFEWVDCSIATRACCRGSGSATTGANPCSSS